MHYVTRYWTTKITPRGSFLHYNFLKPHSTSHTIMFINSLAVGAIPRNSKIIYVTVNNLKSYLITPYSHMPI